MELYTAMKHRRTRYDLSGDSPISDQRIEEILKDAVTYTPSAFHSQTSRAILLFGERHQKLWNIVAETLREIVPADRFTATKTKLEGFAAGHGTILYFEDMDIVHEMQKNVPLYAENFPIWSNQSAGMLQYAVWTALSQEGLGASLQHYNPIIDGAVASEFQVPASWKLVAQMPFGTPLGEPTPIAYRPVEERVLVQGGATA